MNAPEQARAICDRILGQVDQVVVGKRDQARMLLAAVTVSGHVLLEDVPGVGKTLLARTFAAATLLGFKRVQFTPDLLPSDVTGTYIWSPTTVLRWAVALLLVLLRPVGYLAEYFINLLQKRLGNLPQQQFERPPSTSLLDQLQKQAPEHIPSLFYWSWRGPWRRRWWSLSGGYSGAKPNP